MTRVRFPRALTASVGLVMLAASHVVGAPEALEHGPRIGPVAPGVEHGVGGL